MSEWIATIGLETHVQLKTRTKIWCGCPNDFGPAPNTLVCPVCLGYPGALPVLNREAVKLTAKSGMILGCTINTYSKHDRKSYFYPDMPKNYQITQFDQPLCLRGQVTIEVNGQVREIQLNRIHLEEDVGKSTHFENSSGLDYNRAGTPLMEIVTEPDLHNPDEVMAYLTALKEMLVVGGVTAGNLEEGNIRCDLNVSIARKGSATLGTKAEIKNMNTFRGVHRALTYEIARQIKLVESGGAVVQETRRWDDDQGVTSSMRTKEDSHDYRYFPDPDLLPIVLSEKELAEWRAELPEMPAARRNRFVQVLGLPEYDAGVLVADSSIAQFFESVVAQGIAPKTASNWIMTEVMRFLSEHNQNLEDALLSPEALGALIGFLDAGKINRSQAKEVLEVLLREGGAPGKIIETRGMVQVSDSGALMEMITQVVEEHQGVVHEFLSGKEVALQFLVGQVMKMSRGKANPKAVIEILRKHLADRTENT